MNRVKTAQAVGQVLCKPRLDVKKQWITLEQAIETIIQAVQTKQPIKLPLTQICGEILAEDVTAAIDQPPFPRSPLDGYAFRGKDSAGASKEHPVRLKVVDKIYAGGTSSVTVQPGEAVRLMTGAMIPNGADCVIRQEDTDYSEDVVELYREIKPFQNYCRQGEDYQKGTLLLKAGTKLDFAAVGVLASNGVSAVRVYPKPKVGIIATGDELFDPGKPLPSGKIYDSNLFMMRARLHELGLETKAMQIGDSYDKVADGIVQLLESTDAVITTGGVSVGQKDILNESLPYLSAETLFHGLKMKPGSPAIFSIYRGKPVLSLSGNPFAAAATFELLARPMLAKLANDSTLNCKTTTAILATPFQKASPNRRFVRGLFQNGAVTLPQGHSSGQLSSMVGCNCLVDIAAGSGALKEQTLVKVVLL